MAQENLFVVLPNKLLGEGRTSGFFLPKLFYFCGFCLNGFGGALVGCWQSEEVYCYAGTNSAKHYDCPPFTYNPN